MPPATSDPIPVRHRHHAGPARHDAADRAVEPDGDGRERHADQSGLDRCDRHRRRHRLPGRALPGRRLQHLRPDRDADRPRPSTTPGSPPPPATATACAPPMPPATSDPIPIGHRHHAGPARHDAADRAVEPDGDGPERHADQPGLDRRHRYRRRHRLPGRALPGRRLQHLRPDRDAERRRPSATPGSPPPPATATASARPTPPATSDRIPTPPAPRPWPRRPPTGTISFVQVNAATPQTAADHGCRHRTGGAGGRQPERRRGRLERRRPLRSRRSPTAPATPMRWPSAGR